MLKKLSYLLIILYLGVQYGQNILEFGTDLRINFYFIGMSFTQLLISYLLHKALKNIATYLYLFICIGAFINELFFEGSINYMDVSFGCLGVVYVLFESKIKKIWNK